MANKEKRKNRMLCPQCKGQLIRLGDEYEHHTRKSAAKSRHKHEKSSRHTFAMADLPYMLEELSTLSIAGIIAIVLVVVAAVIATPVLAKSQSEDTETEEAAEDSEPKEIQNLRLLSCPRKNPKSSRLKMEEYIPSRTYPKQP